MKILMLTPYAPYPPNSGGRIRMWEEIQYLGKRHELTIVSFVFSREEYEQRRMLDGCCDRAIMVLHPQKLPSLELQDLLRLPQVFQWYNTPEMTKTLQALGSVKFDLVLIEHIFMAQYQELFSTCAILEEYNIESNIVKQLANLGQNQDRNVHLKKERVFQHAQWMLMAKYENETWPNFPLRVTVSKEDKQELDRRCAVGKTVVIENGINTQSIKAVSHIGSKKVLFMGTMNYFPNVDAVLYMREAILPKIWQVDPGVSFVIAGRDPLQSVRNLASDPRIEVIANPDDMREVARRQAISENIEQ